MQKFLFLIAFIFVFASRSFAIGELPLTPTEKANLEAPVKKALGLSSVSVKAQRLGLTNVTYDFSFGKLSQAQFNNIRTVLAFPFKPGFSFMSYDATKSYSLSDFLLPKMQAPVGKTYAGQIDFPWLESLGEYSTFAPITNCWSTAYDVFLSAQEPYTSYFYTHDDVEVAKVLRSAEYSIVISKKDLRPYDFVLYLAKRRQEQVGINHVAISLGMNLVYEKTGLQPGDFYQVRPIQDEYLDSTTEYRRLIKPLPHPKDIWGALATGRLSTQDLKAVPEDFKSLVVKNEIVGEQRVSVIVPIKIQQSKNGKFIYDPKNSAAQGFEESSIFAEIMSEQKYGYADASDKNILCEIKGTNVLVGGNQALGHFLEVGIVEKPIIGIEDPNELYGCYDKAGKKQLKFWVPFSSLVDAG